MVSALILGWALGTVGAAEPDAAQPPDLAAYQAAKARAGRDVDAHVALALWCEAHGMAAEKAKHLARAVLIDPSNARARGLLGYVERDGRWMRPEEVSKAVEESPEAQALFGEYQQRRIKAADKADDQYKLARWCDEHGLAQQATAHYHRVVELDPGRDLAWKHLGFKKVDGRWVKPEVEAARKAEADAQEKADKYWKPKLEKLKAALSGNVKAKKAEALAEIAKIDDPRAVPAAWAVFARGGEQSQKIALQIFRRIDAPGASQALAMLAMFSPAASMRSEASQSLTRRDPREFARLLASLIQDEIKYKKKDVAGPGSQGELFVEGKDANVKRLYTPLQRPQVPSDAWMNFDEYGMLVATRNTPDYAGPRAPTTGISVGALPYFGVKPGVNLPASGLFSSPGSGAAKATAALSSTLKDIGVPSSAANRVMDLFSIPKGAVGPQFGINATLILRDTVQIPVGRMMAEAQASAEVAQRQLAQDVQQIEAYNAPIRAINERASAILKNVSGQDLGDDRDKWMEWVYDVEGYGHPLMASTSTPPTIVEAVPLDYMPQAMPVAVARSIVALSNLGPSCFAGGTLVRTLRGDRPIEEVRAGDQVLTQDTTTGKLDYRPVVTVFHNPPNWTYRIDLGGESVSPTGIHRLWKAGHGWIMTRDVKAGDRLRTVGGTVEVVSASKDKVQPVFNLLVEGGDNYCVGGLGVLAHDNGFVEPVERPFDGVPALADLRAFKP